MFFVAVAFMDFTDSTHTNTVKISAAGCEKQIPAIPRNFGRDKINGI